MIRRWTNIIPTTLKLTDCRFDEGITIAGMEKDSDRNERTNQYATILPRPYYKGSLYVDLLL